MKITIKNVGPENTLYTYAQMSQMAGIFRTPTGCSRFISNGDGIILYVGSGNNKFEKPLGWEKDMFVKLNESITFE